MDVLSRGADESLLIGASESGNDVFFATSNPVIASDKDGANDIYDVRIGGGFKEPPPPTPPCVSEACQGPGASAPASGQAGSTSYSGPANHKSRKHAKKHHRRGKHHKKKHQRGKHHRQTTRAHG